MATLGEDVERFRQWAERRYGSSPRSGEWESEYPDWGRLYESAEQFLGATTRTLTARESELLLYLLARDNEDERILETLRTYPRIAMQLAHAAVGHSDPNARWQVAVLLGRLRSSEAMTLLQRFTQDADEYVRRRANAAIDTLIPNQGLADESNDHAAAPRLMVAITMQA